MSTEHTSKHSDDARVSKPAAKAEVQPVATPAPVVRRTADLADPQAASPEQVRHLQRQVGNRAVNQLLNNHTVQAKLTVGPAGDRYEQEADKMADSVMRSANATPPEQDETAGPQ